MRRWMWGVLGALLLVLLGLSVLLPGLRVPEEDGDVSPLDALGLLLQEEDGALVVLAVMENSPADRCGIQPGDTLLALDDEPLSDIAGLDALLLERADTGCRMTLQVLRLDSSLSLTLRLP